MTPVRRWCVVAALAIVVVAVPLVPRLLPVADSDRSAADLLADVQASGDVGYSGLVETAGSVQLPLGDDLGEVGELFADSSRLRVWWRDDQAWRVARLLTTGEQDVVRDGPVTVSFDYEDDRAVVTRDPDIRLPRAADLVPPAFARTVLDGASVDATRRLASRRVAGVAALGLRYTPPGRTSTIARVDVWADPDSGLPLRVEVTAHGQDRPGFVTSFSEVALEPPEDADVAFRPADSVEVDQEDAVDVADAASRYAPFVVPSTLAGLDLDSEPGTAAGVYGAGVTRFLVLPLRDRDADPLREQLAAAPGSVAGTDATSVTSGPLSVLVTGEDGDNGWLLAGTVTPATLEAAADGVRDLPFVDRDGDGG